MKGVKKGYKATWKYPNGTWKEIKIAPRTWKLSFRATKKRPAKGYGGHPKGRRIRWKINALQDVIKTGKGQYKTHMYGTKKLIKATLHKLKNNGRT